MRSPVLFIIAIATIFLTSCTHSAEKDLVKTRFQINKHTFYGKEEVSGGQTDTFYYTSEGKPDFRNIKTTSKEEQKGDMKLTTYFDKDGKVTGSYASFLNEQGLEDSVVFRDETHLTYAHKYIYDKDGYLIEDRQYTEKPPMITTKYKVVDGNRAEVNVVFSPAEDSSVMPNPVTGEMEKLVTHYDEDVIHNEYFIDKPNMPVNKNFGSDVRDPRSKNLQKKSVQLSDKGDTLQFYFFRYGFDDKGRVISAVQVSRDGMEYDSSAYTYY